MIYARRVLLALALVLATATAVLAQDFIKEYNTRPSFSCAFDTDPKSTTIAPYTTLQAAGSSFEYTQGSGSHTGVLSFDGWQDYLDFNRFYDDNGVNFTANSYGEEMSFEVWASWTELRSWSRLFDFGKGLDNNNVFLGNGWTGSVITFSTVSGATTSNTQSTSRTIYADNAVSLYNWQHIAATVRKNASATGVADSGILSIYVNGVLVQTGQGPLPPVTTRPSSWLGRSNWETWGDQRFRGLFDDFFVYNYTLSAEAVAAHYIVPRIAIFDHTFSVDPRTQAVGGSLGYGWLSVDSSDSPANQAAHVGLLSLAGSQFLNLVAHDGANAIGTTLPSIGGAGWAQADADTVGWTFEVTVKFTSIDDGACIFDFTSTAADRIALCLTSSSVQFTVGSTSMVVLAGPQTLRWYTIVVNVQPGDNNVGRYESYVNGTYTNSLATGVWPTAGVRSSAYVGRSASGTYLRAVVDSLRVYDYSLTAAEVRQLYGAISKTLANPPTPLFTSAPSISHTFDVSVPWGVRNGGTKLGWLSAVSTRPGILSLLSTDTQYVNMLTLPDRDYKLFPGFFGGRSVSFEFWVMWNTFNWWERVLDVGNSGVQNGDPLDNFFIATWGTDDTTQAATLVASADGGPFGTTDTRIQLNNAVYLNRWYHLVFTVKVDRTQNPNATTSAEVQLYLNGELKATQLGPVPRFVQRQVAWVGRSRYTNDGYFGGYIDAFHYYDYALEIEQVRAHYAVPRPPLFELTFSRAPQQYPGVNATNTFGWIANETGESATVQANHPGLLTLSAASQQYIDLYSVTSATTIGAIMPPLAVLPDWNLFNRTQEFGTGQAWSRLGMTLEFSFKYTSAAGANAKLWSCGGGQDTRADLFEIGFASGSRDLSLYVSNSDRARSSQVTLISNAATGRWYHVAVQIRPLSAQYDAYWNVFIDGALVAGNQTGTYPYAAVRDTCVLGRSTTGAADTYFDGLVDVFRVYDYVVNSTEIANIVTLISPANTPASNVDCPTTGGAAASSSGSSLSGGAIAGIVIACIVGVVVLAIVLVMFLRSQKNTSSSSSAFGGKAPSNAHVELSEVSQARDEEHESA